MSVFVQIADFTAGRYKLALNQYNEADLQSTIDAHELTIVKTVFGIDLGQLVYDNPEDYLDYTDPFQVDIHGSMVVSGGLKEMLQGIIYFYYIRDQYTKSTVNGVARKLGENSENKDTTSHDVWTRYNNAVNIGRAIQSRLYNDENALFDGYKLEYTLPL